MGKVRFSESTRTQRSIVLEVDKVQTPSWDQLVPHLQVHDLIAFAEQLKAQGAPQHHKVAMVESGKGTGLMRVLRVDWKEETINGEPAPQAEEASHGQ